MIIRIWIPVDPNMTASAEARSMSRSAQPSNTVDLFDFIVDFICMLSLNSAASSATEGKAIVHCLQRAPGQSEACWKHQSMFIIIQLGSCTYSSRADSGLFEGINYSTIHIWLSDTSLFRLARWCLFIMAYQARSRSVISRLFNMQVKLEHVCSHSLRYFSRLVPLYLLTSSVRAGPAEDNSTDTNRKYQSTSMSCYWWSRSAQYKAWSCTSLGMYAIVTRACVRAC